MKTVERIHIEPSPCSEQLVDDEQAGSYGFVGWNRTDKRADGKKGAIGKILFGAATGGRADG